MKVKAGKKNAFTSHATAIVSETVYKNCLAFLSSASILIRRIFSAGFNGIKYDKKNKFSEVARKNIERF